MTLLFDLDGTLLDSNHIWQKIDVDFLARRGLVWTEEYNQGVIHATFPLAARFTKAFCRLPDSEEEIMAEWMEMAFHAYAEEIPLKPGAGDFLGRCARAGYPMALYTSCERRLCLAALEHHGLRALFRRIFFARELGVEKGSPAGFRRVAAELGVSPGDCLFFDDSPVACRGAKEAGFQVVGCYDPLFAAQEAEMQGVCDRYVTSLDEVVL
jgi:HAD superfamily hydrolase (TIGR01509 family)